LGSLLGPDSGCADGAFALDGLADVLDLFTAVELDLRDVGTLEQVGEQADELVALGLRPRRPVPRQRPLGGLREVEDVVGDLANGGAPVVLASFFPELR